MLGDLMDRSVLEKLKEDCREEPPCGPNLEYDPAFLEMVELSEPQAEQQYGSVIREAKDPEWSQVLDRCLKVANRTRDLRVGVLLVEALCHETGWQGLADGMQVLEYWICNQWDTIHPQLDPEDGLDPTQRMSVLARLVSSHDLLRSIEMLPLVSHRSLGHVSFHDYRVLIHGIETTRPLTLTPNDVELIFQETQPRDLELVLQHLRAASESFHRITQFLVATVGSQVWSGVKVIELLHQIEHTLVGRVPKVEMRPAAIEPVAAPTVVSASTVTNVLPQVDPVVGATSIEWKAEPGQVTLTKIQSRAEATAAIDSICSYFEANEPASPVPLLLQRAKRLIPMSFVEILHELAASDATQLLQSLAGGNKNK